MRASLIVLFAVDDTWRAGVYAASGLLTVETFKYVLLLTPALILGTVAGHKAHFEVDEIRFRQIVTTVLMISGILLLR